MGINSVFMVMPILLHIICFHFLFRLLLHFVWQIIIIKHPNESLYTNTHSFNAQFLNSTCLWQGQAICAMLVPDYYGSIYHCTMSVLAQVQNVPLSWNNKKASNFVTDVVFFDSFHKIYLKRYLSAILLTTFAINLC